MEELPRENDLENNEIVPSAERAINRIKELYTEVGPEVGCRLVEANMVLTLADARGQTETPFWWPEKIDKEQLERLVESSNESFRFATTSEEHNKFGPYVFLSVESLLGYEVATRDRRISGIQPFMVSSGWEGLKRWKAETRRALEFNKANGGLPSHAEIDHIYSGVIKGYPDAAILDVGIPGMVRDMRKFKHTEIPFSRLYWGAEPNYDYLPETENADILEHQASWGIILEEFYASSWHQELSQNPHFIAARTRDKVKHEKRWQKVRKNEKKAAG